MHHTFRDPNSMSGSWSYMKKTRSMDNLSANISQEFEDISQDSSDVDKVRAISVPPKGANHYSNSWDPARREETYIEMIKDIGTNIKYNYMGYIGLLGQSVALRDGDSEKKAYLLGQEYVIFENGEEKQEALNKLRKTFSNIIWFSYRKNFPKLNHQQLPADDSYISDTGWGCTIRSCQMLFAECLKRRLLVDIDKINKDDHMNQKVISWFLDCEINPKKAPYSIQTLSTHIYENSQIRPGNWLKPSTALFAIQHVHSLYRERTIKKLHIEIYLEGTIYLDQAVKKVGVEKTAEELAKELQEIEDQFEIVEDFGEGDEVETDQKSVHSQILEEEKPANIDISPIVEQPFTKLFEEDENEVIRLLNMKWTESLMIVVLAKIGLEKPNPEYLSYIKELLSFPESIGMLGGKPGLAYFIVGHTEDKLMYLDPHFVQEAIKNKKDLQNKENLSTYFCSSLRYLNLSDLDTSVGFAFFIKDEKEFESFVKRFKKSCSKKESFLCMEANAPQEHVADFESVDGEDEFDMIAIK